jgi:hypothetical protein
MAATAIVVACAPAAPSAEQEAAPAQEPATSAPSDPAPATEAESEDPTFIEDSFLDEFSGWDVVRAGKGRKGEVLDYVDGSYHVGLTGPATGTASAAPYQGSAPDGDIAVQAVVRIDAGRGVAGVFCRGSADGREGYVAGIGPKGSYSIIRAGGNAPRPLTSPHARDAVVGPPGSDNTVRLECLGSGDSPDATLRLYVNDQLVAEVIDPDPLDDDARAVGVFALRHSPRAPLEAIFDDFVARRHATTV